MMPTPNATAATDSTLCTTCGICCGGLLFASAGLRPEETAWAIRKHLPLLQSGDKLSFEQPCPVLESRGSERICGDYSGRPEVCRSFRCKLLRQYESGAIALDTALRAVSKARTVIDAIERRLARHIGGGNLRAQLASLCTSVLESADLDSVPSDREFLLDVGVLRSILRREFFEP